MLLRTIVETNTATLMMQINSVFVVIISFALITAHEHIDLSIIITLHIIRKPPETIKSATWISFKLRFGLLYQATQFKLVFVVRFHFSYHFPWQGFDILNFCRAPSSVVFELNSAQSNFTIWTSKSFPFK